MRITDRESLREAVRNTSEQLRDEFDKRDEPFQVKIRFEDDDWGTKRCYECNTEVAFGEQSCHNCGNTTFRL